jgi:hypothetical protein
MPKQRLLYWYEVYQNTNVACRQTPTHTFKKRINTEKFGNGEIISATGV